MSTDLIWPIVCLVAGLSLLILEVFIPSGGLIGLLALGLLGISLWQAFAIDTTTGLTFSILLIVLLPVALALAVRLWPKTPMGKWIFLQPPEPEDLAPEPQRTRIDHLVGQFGRALTPLRPSGVVDFEGRRLDALSEEGLIPSGSLVRAVQVRGGQLVVRKASEHSFDELMSEA